MTDLLRQARRRPLIDADSKVQPVDLDREDLGRLLRHRGPMLLLDRLVGVDLESGIAVAERYLAPADPAFDGHFPQDPIYPGSFQVEALGQLGLTLSWFLESQTLEVPRRIAPPLVRLTGIGGARFVSEARPGDTLTLVAKRIADTGLTLTCVGQICIGDRIVSACTFDALIGEAQ